LLDKLGNAGIAVSLWDGGEQPNGICPADKCNGPGCGADGRTEPNNIVPPTAASDGSR
jgi:hypothetical protein